MISHKEKICIVSFKFLSSRSFVHLIHIRLLMTHTIPTFHFQSIQIIVEVHLICPPNLSTLKITTNLSIQFNHILVFFAGFAAREFQIQQANRCAVVVLGAAVN